MIDDDRGLYSGLFENQHIIMLIYDPQTFNIVDANPAACQFYGYTHAQLTTLKIIDLNGWSHDRAAQELQRSQRIRPQLPYVLQHRLASGETRDVEVYTGPIEINGTVYQYSIVHDVTRRKQADDELRRERNFVSAVLDTVGALVVVLDRAGRIVRFNRACEKLTGYAADEVIDHHVWDNLLVPEEIDTVRAVFEKLRAGDFPQEFENQWVMKDGRARLIAWSNTALTNDAGTIEYVIATGVDITERQQTEQEIRRISSFPLLNPNPVLEVDRTGGVTFCNPGALHLLEQQGVTSDAQLFVPDDWPAVVREFDHDPDAVVLREVVVGQLTFAESIHLARGFDTIRIFASDMTERKQVEARLRQSNADLQARNTELDAFAHTVAHDIKNPLHILTGYAELLSLRQSPLSPTETLKALQAIQKNIQKINSITDSLMLLAEVRQKPVTKQALSMAEIVAEAMQRTAHLRDGQVELRLPAEWPTALGYAPWVEQVWVNYLSNALKHVTRPGCVELGAALEASGFVRFWIRDDGPGIAPEEQVELFTAFYRTSHTRRGGHGLGLSIVKRIVEQLGGEVSVTSSGVPGEGSTFGFTLPAA